MGLPPKEETTRVQPQSSISNQSGVGLLVTERRFGSFSTTKRAAGVGTFEEPPIGGDRLERVASTAGMDRRNEDSRSIAPTAALPPAATNLHGGLVEPRQTMTGRRGEKAAASRGSSWGVGPRTVTREDLVRLDEEIANLSKTVEQVRMSAFLPNADAKLLVRCLDLFWNVVLACKARNVFSIFFVYSCRTFVNFSSFSD